MDNEKDKIEDYTYVFNDLDGKSTFKIYSSKANLPPPLTPITDIPHTYTTGTASADYDELISEMDDQLADMEGRLDVLLTDCVFSSDLATVHSQIADLLNENNLLKNKINDLTKENNILSRELLSIKETTNYLLNTISTLQK